MKCARSDFRCLYSYPVTRDRSDCLLTNPYSVCSHHTGLPVCDVCINVSFKTILYYKLCWLMIQWSWCNLLQLGGARVHKLSDCLRTDNSSESEQKCVAIVCPLGLFDTWVKFSKNWSDLWCMRIDSWAHTKMCTLGCTTRKDISRTYPCEWLGDEKIIFSVPQSGNL